MDMEGFNESTDSGFVLLGVTVVSWLSKEGCGFFKGRILKYSGMKWHVDYKYFKILQPKKKKEIKPIWQNVHSCFI